MGGFCDGNINDDGPGYLSIGLEGIIESSTVGIRTPPRRSFGATCSAGLCVLMSSISEVCEPATRVASEIPL